MTLEVVWWSLAFVAALFVATCAPCGLGCVPAATPHGDAGDAGFTLVVLPAGWDAGSGSGGF